MKKLISFLLAAVMVFSLAACGEDSSTPSPSGNSQSASSTPNSTSASGLSGDIKIIPGKNALDALTTDFSFTWKTYTGLTQTLCRIGADWFYSYDYTNMNPGYEPDTDGIVYCAFVAGDYYEWSPVSMDGLEEPKKRLTSYKDWDELLEDRLDYDGFDEFGSLSTWLQMSLDWTNGGKRTANLKHIIQKEMEFKGKEEIAGVMCDVVLLYDYEYAFDPDSGILFRFTNLREKSNPVQFVVVEYDSNPEKLGAYPG
jgi:hypothetical protein